MKTSLDARGLACPLPVVKANEALAGMTGGTLEVHADNAVAVENLKRLAAQRGLDVAVTQPEDAHFIVAMTVGESAPVAAQAEVTCLPYRRNVVVAVGTDVMGRGSDELGRVLLKGFLYALAHQPELPQTILFYNGGASLTCEGSPMLEDLKTLESEGVEIMTCGTCLNYYGLTEKLAVGSVTNMYAIVEKLIHAGNVVKP